MDVLITGDSLRMHLAGARGVPTLAVFTSNEAILTTDYTSVRADKSSQPRSACHVANNACPLGLKTCVAHENDSIG